jgi:hypothetical protein
MSIIYPKITSAAASVQGPSTAHKTETIGPVVFSENFEITLVFL